MTEKELMLRGEMYNPMDPKLLKERNQARHLFEEINNLGEANKQKRDQLFYQLFGTAGENLYVEPPFYCDYGSNIHLGKDVFINFNSVFLDVCKITIGDRVMIAPNVSLFTATHPLEAKARNSGKELGAPISIGNDVWLGGGVIINPGVTIGNGVVVGSGAVVTKDIPDNVFVAGNPAKVIRTIEQ